jgi:hypothetical protein
MAKLALHFRIIVSNILKRVKALTACGSSAGMMIASPVFN